MKYYVWWLCFSILCACTTGYATSQKPIKFISVADIHFDPFIGCSKSVKACPLFDALQKTSFKEWSHVFEKLDHTKVQAYKDTSFRLFENTLSEMKKSSELEHPEFMIILGDFLGHEIREDFLLHSKNKSHKAYEEFIRKIFQFIHLEFSKNFPTMSIYPVIGNNDSYSGDYSVIPKGNFFKDLTQIWANSILEKNNRENFHNSFPYAGYYEITLPNNPGKKIIVLNSVVFSVNGQNLSATAAKEEFKWLKEKLNVAENAHEKLILAYHIPVGVDVYGTVQSKFNSITQFWKMPYTTQFEKLLEKYKVVSVILSGHIHIDSIQAITLKQFAGVSVNITPSISPIFGNDPAFKLITLNPDSFRIETTETVNTPLVYSHLESEPHHKKTHIC